MVKAQIVAPAYNEAEVLPRFIAAFLALRAELELSADLHLLIVDDGSTDGTLAVLRGAAAAHPECLGYLSFTGNAGHQAALIAGMLHATAWPDVLVTMDSDLEHPLETVPRMIDEWRETNAIVVHAIRRDVKELGRRKRWPSAAFYRIAAGLTGLPLRPGQADFKLWDASAIRTLTPYLPHVGSLRVFGAWMPGRQVSVDYDQHVDRGRKSRFTLRKNVELAVISIVRFSHVPLRAITGLGLMGLLFTLLYGAFIAVETYRGHTVPGWASTVLTVMSMGCLQLVSIGILASYMSRLVFARDLPLFVIREKHLTAEPMHESCSRLPSAVDLPHAPPRE